MEVLVDGSHGEGGGQIVRSSLALSSLTGNAVRITGIRSNRPNPGLQPQHLKCIEALQSWTGASCVGAEIGSQEIFFVPGELKSKTVSIDIGTAGSITLLTQAVLLPALFSKGPVRFSIRGGTDVPWSMSWDYFANVVLPQFRLLGGIEASLVKRGYYPRGGGEVRLRVVPRFASFAEAKEELESIPYNLTGQGILHVVRGVSHASSDLEERAVAERQARACHHVLLELGVPVSIMSSYQDALSTGSGVGVWALFSDRPDEISLEKPVILGADCLGKRDLSASAVGQTAGLTLLSSVKSGACLDSHLADNIIPLLALRGGSVTVESVTNHVLTNIYVIGKFLGSEFGIEGNRIWRKQ